MAFSSITAPPSSSIGSPVRPAVTMIGPCSCAIAASAAATAAKAPKDGASFLINVEATRFSPASIYLLANDATWLAFRGQGFGGTPLWWRR